MEKPSDGQSDGFLEVPPRWVRGAIRVLYDNHHGWGRRCVLYTIEKGLSREKFRKEDGSVGFNLAGKTDAATTQGGGLNVSTTPLNRAQGRGNPAPQAIEYQN